MSSDLITRMVKQAELDDLADKKAMADMAQPHTMCRLADGVLSSLERMGPAVDGQTEDAPDPRFLSSPDRLHMNFEMASLRARSRLEASRYAEPSVSAAMEAGRLHYNKGQALCESPIEKYLLAWLVFGDFEPIGTAPVPVVGVADSSLFSQKSSVYIVPQLNFGPYRPDFAFVARRAATSLIVAIECDGVEYHDALSDRRRDAFLAAFRIPVVRAGGREIRRNPIAVVERVARLVEAWAQKVA